MCKTFAKLLKYFVGLSGGELKFLGNLARGAKIPEMREIAQM